jgi:hypothetical protein
MAIGKKIFDDFFETEYVKSGRKDKDVETKAELKEAFTSAFTLMTWWRYDETEYPPLGKTQGYYNSSRFTPRVVDDKEVNEFEDYIVIIPQLKKTWASDLSSIILSIPSAKPTYFYLGILLLQDNLTKKEIETFKGMSEEALHEAVLPFITDAKKNYLTPA